jgi:hypothetical protein
MGANVSFVLLSLPSPLSLVVLSLPTKQDLNETDLLSLTSQGANALASTARPLDASECRWKCNDGAEGEECGGKFAFFVFSPFRSYAHALLSRILSFLVQVNADSTSTPSSPLHRPLRTSKSASAGGGTATS